MDLNDIPNLDGGLVSRILNQSGVLPICDEARITLNSRDVVLAHVAGIVNDPRICEEPRIYFSHTARDNGNNIFVGTSTGDNKNSTLAYVRCEDVVSYQSIRQ